MNWTTKNWIWIGVLCVPTVLIAIIVPVAIYSHREPDYSLTTGHYTLYSYVESRIDENDRQHEEFISGPFDFLGDEIVSGEITVNAISKDQYESEGPENGNLISFNKKKRYSIDISFTDTSGNTIQYVPRFTDTADSGSAPFHLTYAPEDTGIAQNVNMTLNSHYRPYQYCDGYDPLNGQVNFLEKSPICK